MSCSTLVLFTIFSVWQPYVVTDLSKMYTSTCHMVDASDSCYTYVHIYPTYMPMKYMAHIPNGVGIFVSDTYIYIYFGDKL